MKLNKEEILISGILTILASRFPYGIPLIPICAFLWALTGSESKYNSKLWRRLIVPTLWSVSYWNPYAIICIPISFGFLTLGYGIPDVNDKKGSALGSFFYKLTGGSMLWSNILTRGFVYGGAVIPFTVFRLAKP